MSCVEGHDADLSVTAELTNFEIGETIPRYRVYRSSLLVGVIERRRELR